MNFDKLAQIMKDKNVSHEEISKFIGIDRSTFYRKMNQQSTEFTISQVKMIAKFLNLSEEEFNDIFLGSRVR